VETVKAVEVVEAQVKIAGGNLFTALKPLPRLGFSRIDDEKYLPALT
jgi:hypothetical protein